MVGDEKVATGMMRVTCDAEPDGGKQEEEEVEEVVDAVSERELVSSSRPGHTSSRTDARWPPSGPCSDRPATSGPPSPSPRSAVSARCSRRACLVATEAAAPVAAPRPHELARDALGLPAVLFCIVTGAAPLAAMMFNVPVAVSGGGYAVPAAFLVATIALTIFSTGYIEMCAAGDLRPAASTRSSRAGWATSWGSARAS